MLIRVADYIASEFERKGVRAIFLLSGGGMMHLQDSLAVNGKIRTVYHHHEQCAGIAADAYSRTTGGLGVCYATSGPGGLNTVMAVAGAYYDSSPVVFISGQSKVSQTIKNSRVTGLRQFGIFEADIIEIVRPITKFVYFLDRSEEVPYILDKACDIALSGRPGPVFLDIPVDIQAASIVPEKCKKYSPLSYRHEPDEGIIYRIADAWSKAERPLILAGYGIRVASAVSELKKVASHTATPIVLTQFGADILEYDDQWYIGHPGIKGDRAANFAVQNADFIIAVGASLHIFSTGYEFDKFATGAFIVQVDIDPSNFDRENVGVSIKCLAEVRSFLSSVASKNAFQSVDLNVRRKWQDWNLKNKLRFDIQAEPHKNETGRINIYRVIDETVNITKGDEIVISDAGTSFYVVGQAWKIKGQQRILSSGALGAMGWAVPAATGAAISFPEKEILCLTGDGSLMTNLHELAVIASQNLNIKLIIFNNDGYLSIKNTQDSFFQGRRTGVDEKSGVFIPNLKSIASTFGLEHRIANDIATYRMILTECFAKKGPFLIEVMTNLHQEVIPTVSSKKLDDGSMVSMPIDNMSPFMQEKDIEALIREIHN